MNTKGIEIFGLFRRKREFYDNIDTILLIIGNSGKLLNLFSEKHILNKKITLVENGAIVFQ